MAWPSTIATGSLAWAPAAKTPLKATARMVTADLIMEPSNDDGRRRGRPSRKCVVCLELGGFGLGRDDRDDATAAAFLEVHRARGASVDRVVLADADAEARLELRAALA